MKKKKTFPKLQVATGLQKQITMKNYGAWAKELGVFQPLSSSRKLSCISAMALQGPVNRVAVTHVVS